MHVSRILDPHAKKVAAVLEDMLARTRAGRIPSLLFIAEELGQYRYGMVGRFRSDPAKAIGHLAMLNERVIDFASTITPGLDDIE